MDVLLDGWIIAMNENGPFPFPCPSVQAMTNEKVICHHQGHLQYGQGLPCGSHKRQGILIPAVLRKEPCPLQEGQESPWCSSWEQPRGVEELRSRVWCEVRTHMSLVPAGRFLVCLQLCYGVSHPLLLQSLVNLL